MKKFLLGLAMLVGVATYANETVNVIEKKGVVVESITIDVQDEVDYGKAFLAGELDGKRFGKKAGGNFAVGFLFGLIGTGIVALTSDQSPSWEAAQFRNNEELTNSIGYRQGFSKGARSKATTSALGGTLAVILASVLLL